MPRSKDDSLVAPFARIDGSMLGDGAPAGEDLAREIERMIASGALAAGERLPSERDLAETLAVSRPIVSQAIRILVVRGFVESRRGSGSYVAPRQPEASRLIVDLEGGDLPKMAEFRLWLETAGVVEAVSRASTEEVVRGEDALKRMWESAGDTATWMSADTAFHATLVRFAHNPYLSAVYQTVHTAVISREYANWMASGEVPSWLYPSEAAAMHALHEPILQAIKNRDAAAARHAVLRHHQVMTTHLSEAEI